MFLYRSGSSLFSKVGLRSMRDRIEKEKESNKSKMQQERNKTW